VFHIECSACRLRSRLERLLAIRARFADARPVVLHSGPFLSVIERSREEGLLLVLNAHPESSLGASVGVSRALAGRRLVRDGVGEARLVSSAGSVFVEAPARSYALFVTERLHAAPLLQDGELVSSSRALRPLFSTRERPARPWTDVPLGWVEALLAA
jgi:hypothetical protein